MARISFPPRADFLPAGGIARPVPRSATTLTAGKQLPGDSRQVQQMLAESRVITWQEQALRPARPGPQLGVHQAREPADGLGRQREVLQEVLLA